MPSIHSHNDLNALQDFIANRDYFILGMLDSVDYGHSAASEESELSRESVRLLTEICNSVTAILPEIEADLGDFAADLEELI
jgi:hypothetical protein